ncbi:AmmeMemoRadiSam system protein A [Patescibacteria group bacterium]
MNAYTKLAREAIKKKLTANEIIIAPSDLSADLTSKKSGVFVTLETSKDKKLRGCIGTFLPSKDSIAEEIIHNAIAAATEDYRFEPITADELSDLTVAVSLLHKPEQIKSIEKLDVNKYGVIVKTADGRSGLLLPDIPSVKSPTEQISIAAQKGGIDIAKDNVYLYRFLVDKHEE